MKWSEQRAAPDRPLAEADRLQRQAARLGFDWPALDPLWDKLHEEIGELREAIASGDTGAMTDELGDLLFMLVNFARFLQVDPGGALHRTNEKFIGRLASVEQALQDRGRPWSEASLDELEALWQAAKGLPDDAPSG